MQDEFNFTTDDETRGKNIRINIDKYQYDKLIDMVRKSGDSSLLKAILEKQTVVDKYNINKLNAMEKATEVRTAKAKKDIKLAFEYLVRNDKKVTQKAIAEASKCSVNTCRKYDYIWKK